jgi:hypothetical protein
VADQREVILSRLVALCGAVSGVQAVVRNRLDAGGLARPAVVILDGLEQVADQHPGSNYSDLQMMELAPLITVFVRSGGTADPGVLMSTYRTAIIGAILRDGTIRDAIGSPNGRMTYQGCTVLAPDAEAQEHRIELSLLFRYVFRLGDLP